VEDQQHGNRQDNKRTSHGHRYQYRQSYR
jgi:hypothetical protein